MSINSTCELFGVSRQVYYRSLKSREKSQNKAIDVVSLVQEIRREMPRIGTRKLYHILYDKLETLDVGRDKLFKILKANNLLVKPKRNYHKTTNSLHRFYKHKNLIKDLEINRPEQVWVSDITYLGQRGNHRYLALITDAYSKKVVGFDLSESLSLDGSIRALKMAIKGRSNKKKSLIHHSDRGLQYCSNDYQDLLSKNNITTSMTEQSDPYENAIAERINGILKNEFLLENFKCNLQEMRTIIRECIEIYNKKRPHWSCYMQTPQWMHKQDSLEIKTYKKIYDVGYIANII